MSGSAGAMWALRSSLPGGGHGGGSYACWMPQKGTSPGYAKLWEGRYKLCERPDAVELALGLARGAM